MHLAASWWLNLRVKWRQFLLHISQFPGQKQDQEITKILEDAKQDKQYYRERGMV